MWGGGGVFMWEMEGGVCMWGGRWREECACRKGGGEVEGRGCVNIEVYVKVVSNPDPEGVGMRLMSRRRGCEVGV